MFRVHFLPEGKTVFVPEGTTLLEAAGQSHLPLDAPCGGMGSCKKCLVRLMDAGQEQEVLACQTRIDRDMTVYLNQDTDHRILQQGVLRPVHIDPSVTSVYQDGAFQVRYNDEILATKETDPPLYGIAFDIGTTTVVGYLMDLKTGASLASVSMLNPQFQFGADVIMRANYALEHGEKPLSDAIRGALNTLIDKAAKEAGINPEDIYLITAVGNTCMHHLLLGLSPKSLVLAPYLPLVTDPLTVSAGEYGLQIHPNGKLHVLSNIAGFVGADTVSVLLAVDFDTIEKQTLIIDIGTNGELVMGNKEEAYTCSTAAGPAFEGAKITCGMRGAKGAIDHVTMQDGVFSYTTVGNAEAEGICGSGLIDLAAVLLDAGVIDDSGKLLDPDELPPRAATLRSRIQTIDGIKAFVIRDDPEKPVFLNQKDIREIQLAKGAISAGIVLLADTLKLPLNEIQEVLIAGAFGTYMNPESACRIGLIPPVLQKRISPIGNAAGEGAKIALLNQKEAQKSANTAKRIHFLELANHPDFEDTFIDSLAFPTKEEFSWTN